MKLTDAETPRLLLDPDRLQRNIDAMAACCANLGVTHRPHLKTPKSVKVAERAIPDKSDPLTVSTLREAEAFAAGGYKDILCAAATAPTKLPHAESIQRETDARVILVTDSAALVEAADEKAGQLGTRFDFLIEIDCGEHRSGVRPVSPELLDVAAKLKDAGNLHLCGVMTHAGHSYALDDVGKIADLAEVERTAAADSAEALRAAGHDCDIVSVGSTPTVLHARHLEGVTEARAGVYLFWDLAQYSRKICTLEDIAVTVLATVIGHNRAGQSLVLDSGALALSKDDSANTFAPDVNYGYLCDVETLERLKGLSIATAYQEHGIVPVSDESWFEKLPVGAQVRVLPNHTCMTCAAYDSYDVVRDGEIVENWPRVNGW